MKPALLASEDRVAWSEVLAEGLSIAEGRTVTVSGIECTDFGGSSSFLARRLTVTTDDGRSLGVFFKDMNPVHQLPEARAVRTGDLERSRREWWMYRGVLADRTLGTPKLYADRWREDEGQMWLFLEDVGPKRLSRLGDFDLWVEAAGWLARFHEESPGQVSQARAPLVFYDHDYFQIRRNKLERALADLPAEPARIAEAGLARFDEAWQELSGAPVRLVHGEYFGKNVVIRPASACPIAVIDWETVGVGPAWLDLVCISAGRWTDEQRECMWRAYFERDVGKADGTSVGWQDFVTQVRAAAIVSAVAWFGWWSDGDDAHIRRWSEELRRVISWGRGDRC